MKVVKFDPNTPEGQQLAQSYLQGQQPQSAAYQSQTSSQDVTLDPVILNDSSYNRYLPLKVNGASFPLPNSPLLHNRRITSVVVLAPVDYDSVEHDPSRAGSADSASPGTHDHRDGKAVQVAGVRFVSGNILNELIKNPTEGNYRHWLGAEKQFPVSKQSIVLLVTNPSNGPEHAPSKETVTKEVFMYDFNTDNISELKGDLSETFLQVAESNASSDELENIYQHETQHNTPSAAATPSQTNRDLNKRHEDTTPSITDSLSEKKQVIKRQS
uniref:Uncharacterized protein n=1 Tax=Cacopsylla melanoneura TaxID=428564 RepID=A0A8D8W5Z0_9HEMI